MDGPSLNHQSSLIELHVNTNKLEEGEMGSILPDSSRRVEEPTTPHSQVRFQVTPTPRRRKSDGQQTSNRSSSSSGDSVTMERKAPDGGWGWVVVAAAFTINMIADGVGFSFGVFFVEFLDYFQSSKSATAWLGSIFLALPLLLGPIASSLVDRFGCRRATVAGALLATAGFIVSYFVDSFELLFLTFSILPGIGLSLCYVTAVVIVAYYFERRRSLATGISVCGTGVGTFVFAPLVEYLIQEYGWRGAVLIISGIFFNMVVCGMLMRDLAWTKHKYRERTSLSIPGGQDSDSSDSVDSLPDIAKLKRALQSGERWPLDRSEEEQLERLHSSDLQLPTWLSDSTAPPPEVCSQIESDRRLYELVVRLYPHLLPSRSEPPPGQATTCERDRPDGASPSSMSAVCSSCGKTEEKRGSSDESESATAAASIGDDLNLKFADGAHVCKCGAKSANGERGSCRCDQNDRACGRERCVEEQHRHCQRCASKRSKSVPTSRETAESGARMASPESSRVATSPEENRRDGCPCLSGCAQCDNNRRDGTIAASSMLGSEECPHPMLCADRCQCTSQQSRHRQQNGVGGAPVCQTKSQTTQKPGVGDHVQSRGCRSALPQPVRHPARPHVSCEGEPSAAYLRNIRLRRQSMTYRGAMLNIHRYRLRASSCPDIYRNSMITIVSEDEDESCWSCFADVAHALRRMLVVSYFKLPAFTLFAISNFVLYMVYDVPYVYLADHAIAQGTPPDQASVLIAVIGATNVAGVLLIGYVGDKPWVNSTALYVACMLGSGVPTLLVPSFSSYRALLLLAAVFGFCISANYTLAPTILVDLITIDNFTNAYGVLLLVQGVANLIGPPLCGWLHDASGTYDLTFHISGGAMIFSGILLFAVQFLKAGKRMLSTVRSADALQGIL